MKYRQAYQLMKAYGETPEGRLRKPGQVGKEFKRDHTWGEPMVRAHEAVGILCVSGRSDGP